MGRMKAYLMELEEQVDDIMQEIADENDDITFSTYSEMVYDTVAEQVPESIFFEQYIEDNLIEYYFGRNN